MQRSYRHRKNLHVNPHRWNVWVKIEVKLFTEVINLTAEEEDEDERKIVCEQPNSTWDNYFSGDQILDWLGGNRFGDTMTFRMDWLPG